MFATRHIFFQTQPKSVSDRSAQNATNYTNDKAANGKHCTKYQTYKEVKIFIARFEKKNWPLWSAAGPSESIVDPPVYTVADKLDNMQGRPPLDELLSLHLSSVLYVYSYLSSLKHTAFTERRKQRSHCCGLTVRMLLE